MQKRTTLLVLSVIAFFSAFSQGKRYQYTVDLTNVNDDKVHVELLPPSTNDKEITFYMPRIVPGTYAICDYGRFVEQFSATDKRGNALPVERVDINTWKIRNARRLQRIRYWVNDTFDSSVEGPEIFWPAGTNIQADKNFVINTSGFFGFVEGLQHVPFEIHVIRPEEFYGTTGLIAVKDRPVLKSSKSKVDVFRTSDYEELIDSPLMYCHPDTAVLKIANTEVLIGSYSPNKKISAREIAESIRDVLKAQKEFLGGKLPVDKYAFIFYFTDEPVMSYGALEHSYSSLYYMPEGTIEEMSDELRDIAAHEFFHILTPLTVHSEYIHYFDFNTPKMSEHLWMYEGVIEYFASNVMVKYGLITREEYFNILLEKLHTADQFIKDVPFTDISKYTLDKYHDQFYNFYHKGALIALCLDLKLLKISKGKYGLRDLMLDLSKKFGKDKAFKDNELFQEISKLTFPEVNEFFNRYVKGIEVLPITKVLGFVGVRYIEEQKTHDYSLGITSGELGVTQHDNKPRLQIASTERLNAMGTAIGFQEGDILIAINDEPLPELGPELGQVLHKHYKALPDSGTLSYLVLRKNESGEFKEVRLSAPVTRIAIVKKHLIELAADATEEQIALRNVWLKP